MENSESIKSIVREKYSEIATQRPADNAASCCGVGTPGTYTIMADSYANLPGYNPEADLSLGCGLPTQFAQIQPGDTVLDLGSGAGNDCFVARAEAGPTGKVIGVDFTPKMVEMARKNADKLGYNNVEFRLGDIEALPVGDDSVDVVVSNCVLNLVPDKAQVFREIGRVLRPGAHFSISDVVLEGELPAPLAQAAEMHAGCVAGASQLEDYLAMIRAAGFEQLRVQKQKPILIPDHILLEYLSPAELTAFASGKTGIFSITVYAVKPGEKAQKPTSVFREISGAEAKAACCEPGSGCC
jgi:SAM-dependent methyltransferase